MLLIGRSASVDGNVYATDFADPTPKNMGDTLMAIKRAYNDAMLEKPVTAVYNSAQTLDNWVITAGM